MGKKFPIVTRFLFAWMIFRGQPSQLEWHRPLENTSPTSQQTGANTGRWSRVDYASLNGVRLLQASRSQRGTALQTIDPD